MTSLSDGTGWRGQRPAPAVLPELAGTRREPARPEPTEHARLREAERQAQALIEAARQKAAERVEEGYREGLCQGKAEALAESRAAVAGGLAALTAGAGQLRELEQELRERGGKLIVDLALAVARRILRAELTGDPASTLQAVQEALAALPEADAVVVRVAPAQRAVVEEAAPRLTADLPAAATLRVVSDGSLGAGECVVETPACLTDARLESLLAEAQRRLAETPW